MGFSTFYFVNKRVKNLFFTTSEENKSCAHLYKSKQTKMKTPYNRSLNADLITRNGKKVYNTTPDNEFNLLSGYVPVDNAFLLCFWDIETGYCVFTRHPKNVMHVHFDFDLFCQIDNPKPTGYELHYKKFVSSKFATIEDLKHYLHPDIVKKGTIKEIY